MNASREELKELFASKVSTLVAGLETWFEQEVEAIDGSVETSAPAGSGGSIIGMRPAIDSKRVLDARAVTKKVLEMDLPPEIIKPGGYDSCADMIADIVPKLEKVFVGDIKVKKRKSEREMEPA
ncbi:hypothetical protein RFM68_24945 [Mesorhizobium sp. MSK_1335]|uniref:Uncharacterized protein n=1 Tax=Mesorhizobium montanum TaxID=3072323 RepID=A0ABU4ZRU3_9HYPH|nr:hypothetical protein [Mesorhizobium sp. MSK_1335]MDX8527752.1 hypothetical protein [Mesorhizobium sp. MSK_1335]